MEIIFGIIVSVLSLAGAGFFYMVLFLGTKIHEENVVIKRIISGMLFLVTKVSLIFTLFLVFTKRKEIDLILFLSVYGGTLVLGIFVACLVYKLKSIKKIAN